MDRRRWLVVDLHGFARSAKTGALLLLCGSGCVHRESDERVLSAFSGASTWYFPSDVAPEFVAFRDARSARVFKDIMRDGKYRIAPANEPLLCPGVAGAGNHGFVLSVHLDQMSGDGAIASVSQSCRQFLPDCAAAQTCAFIGGVIEYNTQYLLQKTNARWKVVKPLGVNTLIPM